LKDEQISAEEIECRERILHSSQGPPPREKDTYNENDDPSNFEASSLQLKCDNYNIGNKVHAPQIYLEHIYHSS
jgi:hypothetical protein